MMAEKKYSEAIEQYTKAIQIDGKNPVYFANRAAAYSQNGQHEKAVDDAKRAVEVDGKYSKGYSRLGHAHFCLTNYKEAVEAYEKGLELDPENSTMKSSLATARMKLSEVGTRASPSASTAPPRSAPGAGGPGGMDFASMLSNPNFMSMGMRLSYCVCIL